MAVCWWEVPPESPLLLHLPLVGPDRTRPLASARRSSWYTTPRLAGKDQSIEWTRFHSCWYRLIVHRMSTEVRQRFHVLRLGVEKATSSTVSGAGERRQHCQSRGFRYLYTTRVPMCVMAQRISGSGSHGGGAHSQSHRSDLKGPPVSCWYTATGGQLHSQVTRLATS